MHIYTDYAERLLTEIHFLEIIKFYILVAFKSLLYFEFLLFQMNSLIYTSSSHD